VTTEYTDEEKYDCLKRELRLRRHVYPRLLQQGKMSAQQMASEIALIEAMMKDYAPPQLL